MESEITISFVGDLCPINKVQDLFTGDNSKIVYGDVLNEFNQSNYVVANLECPLTSNIQKIKKVGPNLKANPSCIDGIKNGNINVLTLANNHIMDYGAEGLMETIKLCDEKEILTVGAGDNIDTASKPLILVYNNKRIAILNFCEDEFSTTHNDLPGTAPIDCLLNLKSIREANAQSDYLIIVVHGGSEHFELPNPFIRQTFRYYAELGADVVIGHHTHCFSGYEVYNNSHLFYGLGNFLFDYHHNDNQNWNLGLLLKLTIKDTITFRIVPFVQERNDTVRLRFLNDDENIVFQIRLEYLNSCLTDNDKYSMEWLTFVDLRRKDYLSRLLSYNNITKKIVKVLGLYRFTTNNQRLFLKNYFTCQSHNEVMKTILK